MRPIEVPQPVRILSNIPRGFKNRIGTLVNVEGYEASVLVDGRKWPYLLHEIVLSRV